MKINFPLLFIFILLTSLIVGQERDLQFDHVSTEDGLSANTVLSLFQDSEGFLWIGTYNGLNRYDGYNFAIYRNSPDDTLSISDNKIRSICEDKNGNLWIGTWEGGLNRFNKTLETFTRFQHNPNFPSSISPSGIFSLCFDTTGNLWIGTEDSGVDHLDLKEGIFHHYRHNPDDPFSLNSDQIFSVYVDKNNSLWVGTTSGGLMKFVEQQQKFITIFPTDYKAGARNSGITSIFEDGSGILWLGSNDGGLIKFNPLTYKFVHYRHDPRNPNSLKSDDIWVVCGESDGMIWIGNLNEGLNLFDPVNGSFNLFSKEYNNPKSLSDNAVFTICEDRSGVMWFGTWSGGLNKYDRMKKKFKTFFHNPNDENSLSDNTVYSIFVDDSDELWIGTLSGGLNRFDEKNNRFIHYSHNPDDITSLSSSSIFSICEDKAGYIWVATDNAGLNRYDRKTKKFKRFQHNPENPNSLSGNEISQIFCDSYGDLWIGVKYHGLDRLKPNQNDFIHYEPNSSDPNGVKPDLVFSFYEDKSHTLWIGTYGGGLMRYNRQTDDFSYVGNVPNNSNSLSSNIISSICESEKGILWIGTNGAGLNRFDIKSNQVQRYSEKDGLPNDIIWGILSDNLGDLWMSTGKGISKFNIKDETFTNYDRRDGLQDNEFNQWAYTKDSYGRLYFGGVKGFNQINPSQLTKNIYIPQIAIVDFQILHKPVPIGFDSLLGRIVLEKSIEATEVIELTHSENIISFEMAALDFHQPDKNMYTYKLEGFDNHWIETDASHRQITYTNLDPGEYILIVKGSNNDGVWNETGVFLRINIHPPWWSTWWAYILYGFIITFIFGGSTRFYLNREKLKTQLDLEHEHANKLEEVDKMKSNFYANISHEFRTPLMLILGPIEKLTSKLADEESSKQAGLIRGNAKRLLNLINQLLDLSRLEAKKLKLSASRGNIIRFVKRLTREFESIAEQRDILIKFLTDNDSIEAYFDREKMEKIITNVMSNAIKFTPKGGRITVKVSATTNNDVEILIRDSGIGIPKNELNKIFDRFYQVDGSQTREHEGTGIGLALTKEFIDLHRGQILVDSVEGHWTEVKIYFPIGREHLTDSEIVEPTDFELRKIEGVDGLGKDESEIDVIENENLVDKTIVLIVEDNLDLREYIKDDLKEVYHVEEASNGEQGLRKAEKFIPDLIVSDIMMPIMDGYEMMKKIRQDEKTSHIPIILLTAKSDRESKLEGLGLGADDYLTKPFDTQELLVRIKNLIETRRLLQEKFGSGNAAIHKKEKVKISYLDQQFLDRVMTVIDEHISEEEFSIEEFGKDVGMSRSQMHRKLKALTGKSTSLYLRTVRLAKAKQLIEEKKATISEISYQVGFSSPAYFSRCFKEEFGYTPSEVK